MSQPFSFRRRLAAPFALAVLGLLVLLAAGSTGAPAATGLLPEGAIAPTLRQRRLAPRIAQILEQNHYSHVLIDDKFSPQVMDRYLSTLDGQHSYFLASDIAGFARWRARFDDMIHTGELDPAYLMFAVFLQRNRERMHYALKLLDTQPDWAVKESYVFDRLHATWPATEAEMNELWRLRVKNDAITLMLTGKSWPEATDILRKRYQRVLERLDKVTPEDVFETLMNAYASTYDPHTDYFSPRNSEEYQIQMSLSYEGIGATLSLTDDYVTIASVRPGGPAALDGTLKPNDRITAVGQGNEGPMTDVIGWRLDDVVQLIRGKIGTVVRLQILPAGAAPGTTEHILKLTRNKVTLENQAAKKEVRTIQHDGHTYKIGIITVPGFYNDDVGTRDDDADDGHRSTTHDVRKLIEEIKAAGGVDALVLDLRGDGGGFLPEAIGLTGLFIDHGPVVQLKVSSGQLEVLDDTQPGITYTGPLSVLVDRTSASASEIFAAAIQDYHRGIIIGQTTFGKGTVQSVIPLDRWSQRPTEGQLTVTIGKFYRVTGESTQLRGVTPDIALPSPISTSDVGEDTLEHALPWDRIAPAAFTPMQPTIALLPMLRREQIERAAHDADYRWLVARIAALDSARKQKSLSVDLAKRRQVRTEQDQSQLADENARRRADGLAQIKSVADIVAADEPDVLLAQAADIMADLLAAKSAQEPAVPAAAAAAAAGARRTTAHYRSSTR